jgi:hypothetical protein
VATVFTNRGKRWVVDKMRTVETSTQKFVAWGTGAGTAVVTNSSLFTESTEARVSGTVTAVTTDSTGDTYQVVGTITATGSRNITNAGVFDASSSPSDLLMYGDFTAIPVLTNDSIEFTFKLDFDD